MSVESNAARREESKTVVPLEIGDGIGIPLDQSLESPNLYWQYVPQSGAQRTPPVLGSKRGSKERIRL